MSDPTFTTVGDEALEARIVAWVLGEASAFETAELERLCTERPELMVFRRRIAALHALLPDAENPAPDDSWKLPSAKRQAVEELIHVEPAIPSNTDELASARRSARRTILAIAACLILTMAVAGLLAPMTMSQRKSVNDIIAYQAAMDSAVVESEQYERASKMMALNPGYPEERIEGTPKPMNVPGGVNYWFKSDGKEAANQLADNKAAPLPKQSPASGPESDLRLKGNSALSEPLPQIEELAMAEKKVQTSIAPKPSAPAAAMSRVIASQPQEANSIPVPDLAMNEESLRFGDSQDFGTGWGEGGQAGGFARDAQARSREIITEGNRSGDGAITSGSIDAVLEKDSGDMAGYDDMAGGEASDPFSSTAANAPQFLNARPLGRQVMDEVAASDKDLAESSPSEAEAVLHEDAFAAAPADDSMAKAKTGKNLSIEGASLSGAGLKSELSKTDPFAAEPDTVFYAQRGEMPAVGGIDGRKMDDSTLGLEMTDKRMEEPAPERANAERLLRAPEIQKGPKEAEAPPVLEEETSAAEDPFSTFSLNISDASFRIAQAALAKGEQPDPGGIKVEQFYNAVDYGDPAPATGEPVACAVEQAGHPVIPGRNLVRIALKTAAAGRSAGQPLRLTLLVDQSGSMTRGDRREAMDKALAGLAGLLTPQDRVNVVGFSRTSRLIAEGLAGDKAANQLAEVVNPSASEGGTNLETAIDLATQLALRHKTDGAQNRIVLFTDGAANLGDADPERLSGKIEQLRQQGLAFDIAGIAAEDINDRLLADLARKGNGRYHIVGKGAVEDFAKQLAGAFRPAAENVKVQVRFNPERVKGYKLIGFEKDRLKTEDFRNDAVDAAELAAEEAGVAIYQVETIPDGSGEIGEVSVRFRETASGGMVERSWTIAHDTSAPAIDRAAPSMQLATLALFAGEKLKGGPLAAAIDFKNLAAVQAAVKQAYGHDSRVAELLRMIDALK